MEHYQEKLEYIIRQERISGGIWLLMLSAVLVALWVCHWLYFRKKKQHPKAYASKKQTAVRRQTRWACAALTAICIGFGAVLWWQSASTVIRIRQDIEQHAFVTYEGDFYISEGRDNGRWIPVELDREDLAYTSVMWRTRHIGERLTMDRGHFNGKIVYGKNSLVIVDMQFTEEP